MIDLAAWKDHMDYELRRSLDRQSHRKWLLSSHADRSRLVPYLAHHATHSLFCDAGELQTLLSTAAFMQPGWWDTDDGTIMTIRKATLHAITKPLQGQAWSFQSRLQCHASAILTMARAVDAENFTLTAPSASCGAFQVGQADGSCVLRRF